MADIVLFEPKADRDATENLQNFVELCRSRLTIFGSDLPFDDNVWDVTEALGIKGRGKKRERLVFSNLATTGDADMCPMREPFLAFAKAWLRYWHGMRPSKAIAGRLAALRTLEAALSEGGGATDPVRVNGEVLNRAAQIANDRFSKAVAYRIGNQLEALSEFMVQQCLVAVPVKWRNPIGRPRDSQRIGEEFDKRRKEKLPSVAALDALPRVYWLATEPTDVIVTSTVAILCAAPDRIHEVVLLPLDCETRQDLGGGKGEAYGLRWRPGKGAPAMLKYPATPMARIVQDAIGRIRECTEDARTVARWYDANPDRIYLPSYLEYLRGRRLISFDELGKILWGEYSKSAPATWAKEQGLHVEEGEEDVACVRFADVEKAVVAMLPEGFPFLHKDWALRYSDALFVIRRNEFHATRGTFQCVIEPVSIDHIGSRLGVGSSHGKRSIFDRFGFCEDDGNAIKVTTHQFRHYLNTLAQAGGMNQLDIAKWSGRKDVRQNRAYDHVSSHELLLQLQGAVGDEGQMFGPLAELPKNLPISRDEFARLKVPTSHTTDLGFCVHDYSMSPCGQFLDCINCEELVCIKGDALKTQAVRRRLDETEQLLSLVEAEEDAEGIDGTRWVEHQRQTVERLRQLSIILDNPAVPTGAFIQLQVSNSPSRLRQAVDDRLSLRDASSEGKEVAPKSKNGEIDMDLLQRALTDMESLGYGQKGTR